mmetsp:Transcript_8617/g.24307  ORF Transcript_8617/g.24307 Transcript_8617/m.24307 type:complete len:304 (-) Transcript_8617:26-937(-)
MPLQGGAPVGAHVVDSKRGVTTPGRALFELVRRHGHRGHAGATPRGDVRLALHVVAENLSRNALLGVREEHVRVAGLRPEDGVLLRHHLLVRILVGETVEELVDADGCKVNVRVNELKVPPAPGVVPQVDGLVQTADGNDAFGRRERGALEVAAVVPFAHAYGRLCIPDLRFAIHRTRSELRRAPLPVAALYGARVGLPLSHGSHPARIPNAHRPIRRGGEKVPVIRRVLDAGNVEVVTLQRRYLAPRPVIPHAHSPVEAARQKRRLRRIRVDHVYKPLVAPASEEVLARLQIPQYCHRICRA